MILNEIYCLPHNYRSSAAPEFYMLVTKSNSIATAKKTEHLQLGKYIVGNNPSKIVIASNIWTKIQSSCLNNISSIYIIPLVFNFNENGKLSVCFRPLLFCLFLFLLKNMIHLLKNMFVRWRLTLLISKNVWRTFPVKRWLTCDLFSHEYYYRKTCSLLLFAAGF